jgi:hypothetical protein
MSVVRLSKALWPWPSVAFYDVPKHIMFTRYVVPAAGVVSNVTVTCTSVAALIVGRGGFPAVSTCDMHTGLVEPQGFVPQRYTRDGVPLGAVPVRTEICTAWSVPTITDAEAPPPMLGVTVRVPAVPFRTLVLFSTTDSDPRLTIDPLSDREELTTSPAEENSVIAEVVMLEAVANLVPAILLKEEVSKGNPGLTRTVAKLPIVVILETICPITHVPGARDPELKTWQSPPIPVVVDATTRSPVTLDVFVSMKHETCPATAI